MGTEPHDEGCDCAFCETYPTHPTSAQAFQKASPAPSPVPHFSNEEKAALLIVRVELARKALRLVEMTLGENPHAWRDDASWNSLKNLCDECFVDILDKVGSSLALMRQ